MLNLRQFASKINIAPPRARFGEPMAAHTTFRIGGPADLYLRPADETSFLAALALARAEGIPCFILGGGANLLVGDLGLRGVVLDTADLRHVREMPDERAADPDSGRILEAGAGIAMDDLCVEALARGLSGLQHFAGMPGSLGGAVYMNARCYDAEVAGNLAFARCARISASGDSELLRYDMRSGDWAYKRSPFQPDGPFADTVILSAGFRMQGGDGALIGSRMRALRADRQAKGHYLFPCAGSMFKNNRAFGRPTGAILDELGFRGARIGAAAVSPKHANIFVNEGGASAAQMRTLIALARARAREAFGFELEPEVLFVGEFRD